MNSKTLVIFDGDCGFCQRSLRFVRRLDSKGRFTYVDFRDTAALSPLLESHPALKSADFEKAMYAISLKGKVLRGFYAFREIFWHIPWTWMLSVLFYLPGIPWLGERAYSWIAENRFRFGCGSDSCEIDLTKRPPKK